MALGEPGVRGQCVLEPAADVVARGPAAVDHFVVTAAAAQIPRPAAAARLLPVDCALAEPQPLSRAIDAGLDIADGARLVVDEAMAGVQLTGRGDAEIARAGAARIRPVRPAMDLAQRRRQVLEGIALAGHGPPLELAAAVDHGREERTEVRAAERVAARGRVQQRREADAVEAERG